MISSKSGGGFANAGAAASLNDSSRAGPGVLLAALGERAGAGERSLTGAQWWAAAAVSRVVTHNAVNGRAGIARIGVLSGIQAG